MGKSEGRTEIKVNGLWSMQYIYIYIYIYVCVCVCVCVCECVCVCVCVCDLTRSLKILLWWVVSKAITGIKVPKVVLRSR